MPSHVRSYSKINLGLAIGPPRPDGFHSLCTLYQTLALHDIVSVTARRASRTLIQITSNDPRVPRDARNTAWKMVERTLEHLGFSATVNIRIQKDLPIQGGMGAGSANAAAALIGLECELGLNLTQSASLELAAEVGSDVPLFLVGGSSIGSDRGQVVTAVPDITLDDSAEIPCVIALPEIGVSTPQAFRDWDALLASQDALDLHNPEKCCTLEKLGRTYAKVFPILADSKDKVGRTSKSGNPDKLDSSGIIPNPDPLSKQTENRSEKQQSLDHEQRHTRPQEGTSGFEIDLARNSLPALVRSGIENDFETVVFLQSPQLRDIKHILMGTEAESQAVYSALSGSGSALFGLYRSTHDADAAQQRLQQHGVKAIVTKTMPRPLYWNNMLAK
jgi:4-diphosphocytidyl-2-C-methyl-D-erythritol kinase